MVYDDRNPAFRLGGHSQTAFRQTKEALKSEYAHVLRQCSWQEIVHRLRQESTLGWLTDELHLKYGL